LQSHLFKYGLQIHKSIDRDYKSRPASKLKAKSFAGFILQYTFPLLVSRDLQSRLFDQNMDYKSINELIEIINLDQQVGLKAKKV